MIELKLTEVQLQNIKACILSTAKQLNIDEAGMFMLLQLVQDINNQISTQEQKEVPQKKELI